MTEIAKLLDDGAQEAVRDGREKDGQKITASSKGLTERTGIGLNDAIYQAAEEGIYDQSHLIARVLKIRPGTTYPTASAQVSSLLKDSRLHKGEDLIIRPVKNGKIQNLPMPKNVVGYTQQLPQ